MGYLRERAFAHDGIWNDTIHWYATGVRELRTRPFADCTSGRFLAAIHSWHKGLWRILGDVMGDDT